MPKKETEAPTKYSIVVDWSNAKTKRYIATYYKAREHFLFLLLEDGATVMVPWHNVDDIRFEDR